LAQFLETTKLMSPEQRAEHLKHAMDMATANDIIAEEGESRVCFIIKIRISICNIYIGY
jgi:hypothetical protein